MMAVMVTGGASAPAPGLGLGWAGLGWVGLVVAWKVGMAVTREDRTDGFR